VRDYSITSVSKCKSFSKATRNEGNTKKGILQNDLFSVCK
jgi:hypothetical protein